MLKYYELFPNYKGMEVLKNLDKAEILLSGYDLLQLYILHFLCAFRKWFVCVTIHPCLFGQGPLDTERRELSVKEGVGRWTGREGRRLPASTQHVTVWVPCQLCPFQWGLVISVNIACMTNHDNCQNQTVLMSCFFSDIHSFGFPAVAI